MNPDEHPFGQTKYKNYDPEQINNVLDAIELFRWLSKENLKQDHGEASAVFRECAELLEEEVLEE
jgi:hypothetical protein